MMADSHRDPKLFTDWQRLDYFEQPRSLQRWRWRAVGIGVLIGALPAALLLALVFGGCPARARTVALTGPTSRAHASFIDKCDKCHTGEFEPASRFLPGQSDHRSVPDSACLTCHDAGVHSERQTSHVGANGQAGSCASCHREHRGDTLTRFEDWQCAECHADLSTHVKDGGATRFAQSIKTFADHPDFGAWRPGGKLGDPGTLKFPHDKHLGADQLRMMREGVQSRLDKSNDDAGWRDVLTSIDQLSEQSCQFCHQPDARRESFAAINYDRYCSSCHWLTAPLQPPADGWKALESAARRASEPRLRHPRPGQGPATVRGEIMERTARFLRETQYDPPAAPDAPEWRPHLLGALLSPGQQQYVVRQADVAGRTTFLGAAADQTRRAGHGARRAATVDAPRQSLVYEPALWTDAGCAYCHLQKTAPSPRTDHLPVYEETRLFSRRRHDTLPSRQADGRHHGVAQLEERRWFPFARFDHDSHRGMKCDDCHGNARQSSKSNDLLVPTAAADCRQCHDSKKNIRSDCLTCHQYHDRGRERSATGGMSP